MNLATPSAMICLPKNFNLPTGNHNDAEHLITHSLPKGKHSCFAYISQSQAWFFFIGSLREGAPRHRWRSLRKKEKLHALSLRHFPRKMPPVSPAGSGTSGSALSVGKADSSPEGRALLSPTLGEVDCVARRRGLGFALLPPGWRRSRARFFFAIFYYNKASNLEILTFICYNNHNVSKRQ